MVVKRVDVEENANEEIGWSWKDCNGTSESLTISGHYRGTKILLRARRGGIKWK